MSDHRRSARRSRASHRSGGARGPNHAKLFRSKTVNTVLVVPSKARKYRKALYVFDFILTGLGLSALILSAIMMGYSKDTFFPDWIFFILFSVGAATIVMGFLGGRGATVSYQNLESGTQNFWLVTLGFLMGTLLVLEFGLCVWTAIEYGAVNDDKVTSQTDSLSNDFEESLKVKLRDNEEAWWDWQSSFECCGYDNNTIPADLATGKYCTTDPDTSASPCKDQLWEDIADSALPIGLFVFFFLIIQIAVCSSSVCLACVIKAQEPIYRDS